MRIGSVKIKVKLDLSQRVHLVEKHLADFVSVIEVVDIVVHCADIMATVCQKGNKKSPLGLTERALLVKTYQLSLGCLAATLT